MIKYYIRLILPLGLAMLLGCSEGLQPVPFQGISGRVEYIGEPPDSTDWVRLAVYEGRPATVLDLLDFVAVSDTLFLGAPEIPYAMALDPGRYEWLTAVWKKAGEPLSLTSLRVAGWYTGGDSTGRPASFVVEPDSGTADVDVTVDFGNLLTPEEALDSLEVFE